MNDKWFRKPQAFKLKQLLNLDVNECMYGYTHVGSHLYAIILHFVIDVFIRKRMK